jgi:hypothetical protein
MRWNFHGLVIEGLTNDDEVRQHWQTSFASRAVSRPTTSTQPDLSLTLNIVPQVPPRPNGEPVFRKDNLLEYHFAGDAVIAHFPRFGQLRLELARGVTEGQIIPAALHTYGVVEDLIAIGLSPHLRRRGMFLIHAFAASRMQSAPTQSTPMQSAPTQSTPAIPSAPAKSGVLIIGNIGAGKTTTGMALLNAGWKLLSNDSPILNQEAEILSYPGVLAAYPDTFARFETTAHLAAGSGEHTGSPLQDGPKKLTIPAEQVWPDIWLDRAPAAAIFFPQIEARPDHALERLPQPEALRLILPHAIEQWDRAMIPAHLALLNRLVQSAPAYRLRLGPDTSTIPAVIASVL